MAAATSEAGIDTSLLFLAYNGARTKSANDRELLRILDRRKVVKVLEYMMSDNKAKDLTHTLPIWVYESVSFPPYTVPIQSTPFESSSTASVHFLAALLHLAHNTHSGNCFLHFISLS